MKNIFSLLPSKQRLLLIM